jgi:cysteine synthase A
MATLANEPVFKSGLRPATRACGILGAIGNTPLVPLERVFADEDFHLYGKLEMLNPGGSVKDRAALRMVMEGMERGQIGPGTTVIESSSGNLGIGLAQVCSHLGVRFLCVVDTGITPANLAVLKAYGAQVEMVDKPDPVAGNLLAARIARVRELCAAIADSFWINQYANETNALAHRQTMGEIDQALSGQIDYLFVATSTCGTLRGCSDYARHQGMKTRIVAVDAVGSVIFGYPPRKRLIPGHGASRVPELYRVGLEDAHINVTDGECVWGCRRLLRTEAIFAGGSSGAVIAAIGRYREQIEPGSTCVAILCDRGDRYLDTIYSESWVNENLGGGLNT